MHKNLLTARGIYTLLTAELSDDGKTRPQSRFLCSTIRYTQSKFWGNFLMTILPDVVVEPLFSTAQKRSRSLSTLMNRTTTHSMPARLYHALEDTMDEENFLGAVIYTAAQLNQDINPLALHAALTDYENRLFSSDFWLDRYRDFLLRLRPVLNKQGNYNMNKLMLQAALRVAILGLHALYGDRMHDSEALKKLRLSRVCSINVLWELALERAPRLNGPDLSMMRAALRQPHDKYPLGPSSADSLPQYLRDSLPGESILAQADEATCGWYAVANWLDFSISVNDRPIPTFDGAMPLGTLSNGTVVYVLEARGYKGLHVSKGVWGKIVWQDGFAWIPMNLTVRLSGDK